MSSNPPKNNPKTNLKTNPKRSSSEPETHGNEEIQMVHQCVPEEVDKHDDEENAIELPDAVADGDDTRKAKVNYSGSITRDELVRYFEAIALGLRQGTIKFAQESNVMALHPGDTVEFQLKASRKAYLEKIVFELSWRSRNAPTLHILSD